MIFGTLQKIKDWLHCATSDALRIRIAKLHGSNSYICSIGVFITLSATLYTQCPVITFSDAKYTNFHYQYE